MAAALRLMPRNDHSEASRMIPFPPTRLLQAHVDHLAYNQAAPNVDKTEHVVKRREE
jgi:hypothetical protein